METLKKKITENILKIVRNKTINIIVCSINTYTDLASEKYKVVNECTQVIKVQLQNNQ